MEKRKAIAGNTGTGLLKVIAILFMFVDHAGKMLFPAIPEMRILGRIAFPLYCWCMVVGFHYTRSVPKYLLRILLIGLISQPLYMQALNHTWSEPNIFLTLLLALCGLWAMREKKWGSQLWGPVLALILAAALHCDYGWRGVMLVFLLYAAQESKSGIAAVMIAFCLYWGTNSSAVTQLFGLRIGQMPAALSQLLSPWLRVQALAIAALPFMIIPCRKNVRMPLWVGYAIYPAHLLVLMLLEHIML